MKKVVLVDFWAGWCMPCMAIKPIIEELEKQYTDVEFRKVNVDEERDLAVLYRISGIPAVFVFATDKTDKEGNADLQEAMSDAFSGTVLVGARDKSVYEQAILQESKKALGR